MHRQPDSLVSGARHAMTNMAGNCQIIPRAQLDHRSIIKLQRRTAAQQHHPFVGILIVPKTRRADMPAGNNPLDASLAIVEQRGNILSARRRCDVCKEIANPNLLYRDLTKPLSLVSVYEIRLNRCR